MNTAQISQLISDACQKAFNVKISAQVEYPARAFGDFATNVALQLAGQLKKTPLEIAQKLLPHLKDKNIAKASIAKPGFINIVMQPSFWISQLQALDDHYGRLEIGRGQKIQVEFISANPTGPLTLGNARGGYTGDVLARVLQHLGYRVTKEYYFNDAGTQISKLVESVKAAAGLIKGADLQYSGDYIKDLAKKYTKILTTKDDQAIAAALTEDIIKNQIKPTIKQMGIDYDIWFNEKDLVSQFDTTLKRLQKDDLVYEKEGAVWLATTKLGDDQDRVLKKANGDITYLGNDISYHINIFENRQFDTAIKVWGSDHAGQVDSLRLTMEHLFPKAKLKFIILQWVRLVREGKEVAISKRAGAYITVADLIDRVGVDVARFFFLSRSNDSQMDFDLDLAEDQSPKNPLHYIMYSYVRGNSILAQASKKNLKPSQTISKINPLEIILIKQMTKFPELLIDIASTYNVHQLSFYGLELAKIFHDYYESQRIIALQPSMAEERLYLIQHYLKLLDTYFEILGVVPQKKM